MTQGIGYQVWKLDSNLDNIVDFQWECKALYISEPIVYETASRLIIYYTTQDCTTKCKLVVPSCFTQKLKTNKILIIEEKLFDCRAPWLCEQQFWVLQLGCRVLNLHLKKKMWHKLKLTRHNVDCWYAAIVAFSRLESWSPFLVFCFG